MFLDVGQACAVGIVADKEAVAVEARRERIDVLASAQRRNGPSCRGAAGYLHALPHAAYDDIGRAVRRHVVALARKGCRD